MINISDMSVGGSSTCQIASCLGSAGGHGGLEMHAVAWLKAGIIGAPDSVLSVGPAKAVINANPVCLSGQLAGHLNRPRGVDGV
jgi:hypothetical protein